jgi:hypothetical protein
VWLVNLRIPASLLDVSEEIKDTDDVDYDSVDQAYGEELDGEQGLTTNSDDAETTQNPTDDQAPQVPA